MSQELIAKLREQPMVPRRELQREAADLIAWQAAEIERLRAILVKVIDQDSTPLWLVEELDAALKETE
jgi:hypothetical protein